MNYKLKELKLKVFLILLISNLITDLFNNYYYFIFVNPVQV